MKSKIFCVKNRAGIHCRPSGVILNTIKEEFPGHTFTVKTLDAEIQLDSILALISLGLSKGVCAELIVEGPDEAAALQKIAGLFEYEFDFPQNG